MLNLGNPNLISSERVSFKESSTVSKLNSSVMSLHITYLPFPQGLEKFAF